MVYGARRMGRISPVDAGEIPESNKLAYKAYEGGGYPEGYNYWGYGTVLTNAGGRRQLRVPGKDGLYVDSRSPLLSICPLFTSTPAGNCFKLDAYRKVTGQYMQVCGTMGDLIPKSGSWRKPAASGCVKSACS